MILHRFVGNYLKEIMKFKYIAFLFCFIPILGLAGSQSDLNYDYLKYHQQIAEAEKQIADENFREALNMYDEDFEAYDFIFSRDYKIAAQLALSLDERQRAFQYIKDGITAGWDFKELKKDKFLAPLQDDPEWKTIEEEDDSLHHKYLERIDQDIREKVRGMFKKDQWKALGAFIRIGEKAKERYAMNKFAPHSEIQMAELIMILENNGYPGEKLIGNDFWMSTIISHHNSISRQYSKKDTLYASIKPKLIQAIERGEMSPYEYALIDDWYKAVISDRTEPGYGFLTPPVKSSLSITNDLRQKIGLRSIELRNELVDVEEKRGMNFYLPDWVEGKITIKN